MKRYAKRIFKLTALGCLTALPLYGYASGYRMEFQSTSTLADGGDAAVVEDAGTNWYNSAGLVLLPEQIVLSTIHIYDKTIFSGTASAPATVPFFRSNFLASGKATSYGNIDVPALHFSYPICHGQYAFGFSIVPAWGLMQDYGEKSLVRYDVTRIFTKSLNISPSFAMKINDQFSFGIGPDFHYWRLTERNHSRTEALTPADSISRITGDDWGYGAHAGILFRNGDWTRIGLNYRTKVVMNLQGYSDYAFNNDGSFETGNFKLNVPLPATTSLSVYQAITPCWALMGTVAYDQWSTLRDLHGKNYVTPTGLIDVTLEQKYRNTFDFSLGTHYKLTDALLLRGSVKYEQTPTVDSFRNVDFPDGEKLGINVGLRYQINCKAALDLLYAHVFTRTVPINFTSPVTFASVHGTSDTIVDLFGAQIVWNI